MKMIRNFLALMALLMFSCSSPETSDAPETEPVEIDPLPSWNDGDVKSSILNYVREVTQEGTPTFIPEEDRIATFDNDGTLWSEQPVYFQLFFVMDRVKVLAADHPEWADQQPYKAVLENDMAALHDLGMKGLLELLMTTHAGMSTDEFDEIVAQWVAEAKHPVSGKAYTEMIFQPMLELLDYLEANGFTTYIVSGGGMEFLRVWSEEVYGIPEHRVIGSTIQTQFINEDGSIRLERMPELDFIDDKEGKPVAINRYIGKKPVIAVGNSDGDLQMLQWAASNTYPSLEIYIHHTDSVREWAYDRGSPVGGFDKGLDEATEKGWTIVDMAEDWEKVFPDSPPD